jgi:hypothetical protein
MDDRSVILAEIRRQFAPYERPTDFIDGNHCCECAEHYAELEDVPVDDIDYRHVANAGWDPTCFLTPEAFRHYFPGLARIAEEHPEDFMLTLVMRLPVHFAESFSADDRAVVGRLLESWWLRDDLDELTRNHIEHAIELFPAG